LKVDTMVVLKAALTVELTVALMVDEMVVMKELHLVELMVE